jgi:hypothetical protein
LHSDLTENDKCNREKLNSKGGRKVANLEWPEEASLGTVTSE